MQTIGYQLVRVADNAVVQQWGGSFDGLCGRPGVLYLPDGGDHIHCPELDTNYSGYRLEEWRAEQPLADIKAKAKRQISEAAEAARGKVLTLSGPGKGMSYTKVAQEAVTFVATQGAGNYPMLGARVTSGRYPDLAAAASAIIAIEEATTSAAAAIDEIEDRAKLQIDTASSVEQVQAALQVTWP